MNTELSLAAPRRRSCSDSLSAITHLCLCEKSVGTKNRLSVSQLITRRPFLSWAQKKSRLPSGLKCQSLPP